MAQATAQLRYLRMAPRKVRLVADAIRGLTVREAEAQLILRHRRAAQPLLKLLRSCVANAVQLKLRPAYLYISHITVDQGPMLKRSLPRAMGRATPLQKKMSHIFLILSEGTQSAPLFTILKKERVAKTTKKSVKHVEKPEVEVKSKEQPKEKVGFFRRIFRRKSI